MLNQIITQDSKEGARVTAKIRFFCPSGAEPVSAPLEYAGGTGGGKHCGQNIQVPNESTRPSLVKAAAARGRSPERPGMTPPDAEGVESPGLWSEPGVREVLLLDVPVPVASIDGVTLQATPSGTALPSLDDRTVSVWKEVFRGRREK